MDLRPTSLIPCSRSAPASCKNPRLQRRHFRGRFNVTLSSRTPTIHLNRLLLPFQSFRALTKQATQRLTGETKVPLN